MDTWPSLMPAEFDFLRTLPFGRVLPALIERSDTSVVSFLENVSEDETWCEKNALLIKNILDWLTVEFAAQRLSLSLAKRVVDIIYAHRRLYMPLLPKDLIIQEEPANSLLWGMASLYLRHVIERKYKKQQVLVLTFSNLSAHVFKALNDYVYKGSADHLWRDSYTELMQVILQASQWKMDGVLENVTLMIRRYITLENVSEVLRLAQTHLLTELMAAACSVVNESQQQIALHSRYPGDLTLTVFAFKEITQNRVRSLFPLLTGLAFRSMTASDAQARDIVLAATRVRFLDFATSQSFDRDLLELLPSTVDDLDLSDCEWLDEDTAAAFLRRFPELMRLNLSKDTQLTYSFWAQLRSYTQLDALDISYCRQLSDNDFELLTVGNVRLLELNLAWCDRVSEQQLAYLGGRCPGLQKLNVSHLSNMTDRSLVQIAKGCSQLQSLNIASCLFVTDRGIEQAKRLLNEKTQLYVS